MAIVGGLIGAVIGVGLLAVAILFFIKHRRRSQTAPSAVYIESSRDLSDVVSRGQYAPIGGRPKTEVRHLESCFPSNY